MGGVDELEPGSGNSGGVHDDPFHVGEFYQIPELLGVEDEDEKVKLLTKPGKEDLEVVVRTEKQREEEVENMINDRNVDIRKAGVDSKRGISESRTRNRILDKFKFNIDEREKGKWFQRVRRLPGEEGLDWLADNKDNMVSLNAKIGFAEKHGKKVVEITSNEMKSMNGYFRMTFMARRQRYNELFEEFGMKNITDTRKTDREVVESIRSRALYDRLKELKKLNVKPEYQEQYGGLFDSAKRALRGMIKESYLDYLDRRDARANLKLLEGGDKTKNGLMINPENVDELFFHLSHEGIAEDLSHKDLIGFEKMLNGDLYAKIFEDKENSNKKSSANTGDMSDTHDRGGAGDLGKSGLDSAETMKKAA